MAECSWGGGFMEWGSLRGKEEGASETGVKVPRGKAAAGSESLTQMDRRMQPVSSSRPLSCSLPSLVLKPRLGRNSSLDYAM